MTQTAKTYAVFPGLEALFQASKTRRWLNLEPIRHTLREFSDALENITGRDEDLERFLRDNPRPHRADMDRMFVGHTGIQVGIAKMARRMVRVDGLVGCSVGDVARMAVSEVISLKETVDLIWLCTHHRRLCPPGRMANVRPLEGRFTTAQIAWLEATGISFSQWSDRHAAIAGTLAETDRIMAVAAEHDLKIRRLYDYPFHSEAMLPLMRENASIVARWHPARPSLPVFSSVFLRHIADPEETIQEGLAGACRPVKWKQSVETLTREHGVTRFLNIGPSDTLIGWIAESPDHPELAIIDAWDICCREEAA